MMANEQNKTTTVKDDRTELCKYLMAFNSHIIDLYLFKLSGIDSIISRVQHHFIIPLAFDFPAIAQRKQLIAHVLCIESLTKLTWQGQLKCLHGKKLSRIEG